MQYTYVNILSSYTLDAFIYILIISKLHVCKNNQYCFLYNTLTLLNMSYTDTIYKHV